MKETFIIEDGYTEDGYIAAVPGLHPALRFRFRPMLPEEREAISDVIRQKPIAQGNKLMCEALAARIKSWSATNNKGEPLEITPSNVAKLRPKLQGSVYSIIAGYQASDLDPDAPEQADEPEDLALRALIEGRPVGDARTEADQKN